mgnify:CR=1 FL=1
MSSDDHDNVGYGKPPASGRFAKGKSGNPRGRPRGSRNLRSDLESELKELIQVREGSRSARVTKQRALVKRLMAGAIGGERQAANSLLTMIYRLIDHSATPEPASGLSQDDQAIIGAALARRLAAKGNPAEPVEPEPPDPDADQARQPTTSAQPGSKN